MDFKPRHLLPTEVAVLLTDTIKNNTVLAEKGLTPITMCVEGMPGIAKTAVTEQVAETFPTHYYHIDNLADKTPEDLFGYPFKAFEMLKDHKEVFWIPDNVVQNFVQIGYIPTGKVRMDYALPSWLLEANGRPMVLCLDDYNRCSPMMLNACMSLIQHHSFGTWKLPKGSTVILTTNPTDSTFMNSSEDSAQETRRLKVQMKVSVDDWAVWAAKKNIDSRCVNFMLRHKELVEGTQYRETKGGAKEEIVKGNLRSWTNFFNMISYYQDFGANWANIFNFGSGSFPEEHMILFYKFITDKLDKLPSPEEIFKTKDKDKTMKQLREITKDRNDLAALMATRFYNHFVTHQEEMKANKDQLLVYRSILEDDSILSADQVMINIKNITATDPKIMALMLESPKVSAKMAKPTPKSK